MNSEEKRMIMLKNTGSHLFDEAYFVLSDTAKASGIAQTRLIREANRIVNESFISGYFQPSAKKEKNIAERAKYYLLGFFCGAAACTLIYLFLS